MRRKILIVLLVVLGLLLVPIAIGWFLPTSHVAAARTTYQHGAEEVWALVADLEHWPDWNTTILEMRRNPVGKGRSAWIARSEWGEMPLVVDLLEPPRRLRTVIPGDAAIGFRGSWLYEVEPREDGSGSFLTITERGAVDNPVFRFLSLFYDKRSAMNRMMIDLGRTLGESVTPEPLPAAATRPVR